MSSFKIYGVIHLPPLTGSPQNTLEFDHILKLAIHDAGVLCSAHFDGLIIENFGDAPFWPGKVQPNTVAQMAVIAHSVRQVVPDGFEIGINVLRNDPCSALAVGQVSKADFIRVNVHSGAAWTDQGLIQGAARETLNFRKLIGAPSITIYADILVKHASAAGVDDPIILAKDTVYRAGAGGLIFTGSGTGQPCDLEPLKQIKSELPNVPIWIGSGVIPEQIGDVVQLADGAIIGTYLHKDSNITLPLCPIRCSEINDARCLALKSSVL
jgi:uncharacterized protein